MTTPEAPTRVTVGMQFRHVIADGNALWEVTRRMGRGVWEAVVVNEPEEVGGKTYDSDFVGRVDVFREQDILGAVGLAAAFANMHAESDDWFDNLRVGQTVHYCNGFKEFVRCVVVIGTPENTDDRDDLVGRKVLFPVALVGEWRGHDLVNRDREGNIHYGYHAELVIKGTGAWRPSDSCVYESPNCSENYRKTDPTVMPEIDLTPPAMTQEDETRAAKWRLVDAVKQAAENYQEDDPDVVIAAITRALRGGRAADELQDVGAAVRRRQVMAENADDPDFDEASADAAIAAEDLDVTSGLRGRVEFTGDTLSDVEQAIDEAKARITAGNTSGLDRNETGSFTFEVDGTERTEDTDG